MNYLLCGDFSIKQVSVSFCHQFLVYKKQENINNHILVNSYYLFKINIVSQ